MRSIGTACTLLVVVTVGLAGVGCGNSEKTSDASSKAGAAGSLEVRFVGEPPPAATGADLGTCDASTSSQGPELAGNQVIFEASCQSPHRPLLITLQVFGIDSDGNVASVGGLTGASVPRIRGSAVGDLPCSTLRGELVCDVGSVRRMEAEDGRFNLNAVIQFRGNVCDSRLGLTVNVAGPRASLAGFTSPVKAPKQC